MLQFPEEFFQPEVRLDFEIGSKMKHVWAMEMEVLTEIERICKKYNIQYFAYSGTLLGAVRHKGFIPWDDDMDIAMKRKDYIKFMQVASEELPEKWKCCSIYTDDDWDEAFARVINNTVIDISEEYLQKNHGCPYIVGIDIFPLDYLAPSGEEADIVYIMLQHIAGTGWKIKMGETEEAEKCLQEIEEMCNVKFVRDKTILRQLLKLRDAVACLYKEEEATQLISVTATQRKEGIPKYPKEWFAQSISMPFENITVSVPVAYDEVLKVAYGSNYMTPRRDVSGGHDYPFFKDQDKRIEEYRKKQEEGQGASPNE